jgi:hypothetical protein
MNIQDLKYIEVKKVEYSIKIKVQRTPNLIYEEPNDDLLGPLWRSHIISFALTKLFSGGTIFAEFQKGQQKAKWWYSSEVNPSYKLANSKEEFLTQKPMPFRSVIGNFGMAIMNEGYFGAKIFFMSFYDNPKQEVCVSCILSNTSETGFWIKLQNI